MIKINSITAKHKENQTKQLHSNYKAKVDFEIQCSMNELQIRKPIIKDSDHVKYQSAKIGHINRNKWSNQRVNEYSRSKLQKTLTRFYQNVNIKMVNQSEQKIIRALEHLALNKKPESNLLLALNKEFVQFKFLVKNGRQMLNYNIEYVKINIQMLFKCYLQYHKRTLSQAVLLGNIVNKIIKPFLALIKKVKGDTQNIVLNCQVNLKTKAKIITKTQIHKIFNLYLPKQLLSKQLQKSNEKYEKIYEQMYKKYENLPFYSIPCQQDNLVIDEELGEEGYSQQDSKSQNYDKQFIQSRQMDDEKQNFNQINHESKKEDVLSQIQNNIKTQNSKDQFKIKERFEDRFKRQLKNLSDDAGNIIRSRLA